MKYIVNGSVTEYYEGIEEAATDTVEDSVWEVYLQKFVEN